MGSSTARDLSFLYVFDRYPILHKTLGYYPEPHQNLLIITCSNPANTLRNNDVLALYRRYYYVMCSLGSTTYHELTQIRSHISLPS